MIYIIIAIISASLTVLTVKSKENSLKMFFGLLAIILPSIIAAIRYATGTDFFTYFSLFNQKILSEVEISFGFIRDMVLFLNLDFNAFLFIYSFITNAFAFYVIYRQRNEINVFVAMIVYMLFYYTLSFNLIRQSAAMSIVLYSYLYYVDKKIKRFIALSFFAFLLHYTSIIVSVGLIIFYFITNLNKKLRYIIYVCLLFFVLGQNYFLGKINFELGKYNYALNEIQVNNSLFPIAMYMPVLVVAVLANKLSGSLKMAKYTYIYCIGFILMLLMNFGGSNAYRIAFYFTISEVVLLGMVWNVFKYKKLYYINVIIILFLLFKFWFTFIKLGSTEIIPYKWIW